MQVIFKEKHLSIDKFEPFDLPDFAVLTGVNGSGKSHLLEAIENGNVLVDKIEKNKILKFTYENFRMESEPQVTGQQLLSEKQSAWHTFSQQISRILKHYRKNHEARIVAITEECKRQGKPFLSYSDPVVSEYALHLSGVFNHNNGVQNLKLGIELLAKMLYFPIDEIEQENFMENYKPISSNNGLLSQQLGKIFWDYYVKYRNNETNRYLNHSHAKTYPVISEEDFFSRHGEKPWDALNRILSRISSLKYQINSPEGLDNESGYQVKLASLGNPGLEVQFGSLSSGEKTLMALVAAVYKVALDRDFPKILLLDEVDAFLHPSMMNDVLAVIRETFLSKGVKVILVTHSPTTVALAAEGSIYVMNKEGTKRVEKRSRQDALSILTQGYVTLDQGLKILGDADGFGITIITEGHNALIVSKLIEIHGIKGVHVLSGLESISGDTQLKTLFEFFKKVNHKNKILFVWDCDVRAKFEGVNRTFPFTLPQNPSNSFVKKGIENLFPDSVFEERFLKTISLPGKPTIKEFYEGSKAAFADYIVARNNKEDFIYFQPVLEEIRRIDSLP